MPAAKKAQIAGSPRSKLMQVLRASGVSDSAAVSLTNEALGPGRKKKKKKMSQAAGLRQQIISRLRQIGSEARKRNPVSAGVRAGAAAARKIK